MERIGVKWEEGDSSAKKELVDTALWDMLFSRNGVVVGCRDEYKEKKYNYYEKQEEDKECDECDLIDALKGSGAYVNIELNVD